MDVRNQQSVVQQMRVDRLVAEKRRKQQEEKNLTGVAVSNGTLLINSLDQLQQPVSNGQTLEKG